jgi:O-antigen/teichoic acid export membrane protein
MSLSQRVRSGVSWSAASILLSYALGFSRSVILARILTPGDFGVFGMALTVTAALTAVTNVGLDRAIIAQSFTSQEELRAHLNTLWSVELVGKAALSLLIIASVYPAASFYGQEQLYVILPVLSLMPLIDGLKNIGLAMMSKQLDFAKVFRYEQAANLLSLGVSVGLALWLRNVWALVLTQLASALIKVCLSYYFQSYRPRFSFDKSAVRRAFSFGQHAMIISVTVYITTMADNVMVGRVLGASVLGVYALAYNLANLPVGAIADVLSKVTFPAYAELATQGLDLVEKAFAKVLAVSCLLLTISAALTFLLADEIIYVLYGDKWDAAGPILQILTLVGLSRGMVLIISTLHVGLDRPAQVSRGKILEAAVFLTILYPLTLHYGPAGAAWAGVVTYNIALIHRLWSIKYLFPRAFTSILFTFASIMLAGVAGVILGWLALSAVEANILRFVIGGAVSTGMTIMATLLVSPFLRHKAIDALRELIHWIPVRRDAC